MSAHYDRSRHRWIVRWREHGRQRARRFDTEREARGFEAAVCPPKTRAGSRGARRRRRRQAVGRPGRRIRLRHIGRDSLAIRLPAVRPTPHDATRLREPPCSDDRPQHCRRGGPPRRGDRPPGHVSRLLGPVAHRQPALRDRWHAPGLHDPRAEAAPPVVRRSAPDGDRRGPHPRLAR